MTIVVKGPATEGRATGARREPDPRQPTGTAPQRSLPA
jgi:hypothetical protein